MTVVRINKGEPYWGFDVAKVEALKGCRFVGEFCLPTRNGGWSEQPAAVFWQETPPDPSFSQYFGLYRHMFFEGTSVIAGDLMITGAGKVADVLWRGMQADDGEIIFSRFRHDHRVSADGTAMVDGGQDYFKARGTRPVFLKVVGPELVLAPADEWPVRAPATA